MRHRARDPEAPFVPRWTWRALRADRRRNRRGQAPSLLPCALALVVSLFCFLRVFVLLGGTVPAAEGFAGLAADQGPVLRDGMQASLWMVFAAISLGVAGVLLDSEWTPKVRFKRGALRLMLRARPEHLRPPPPPGVAPPPRAPEPASAPIATRVDATDVVAALVRPRPTGAAALPRISLLPPWLSADEAAGARALASLCALVPAAPAVA